MNIIGVFPLDLFLYFNSSIVLVGFVGLFINRQNLIRSMICLEIMFLGTSLNFVFISWYLDDFQGSIFSMVLIGVAGCEVSLGIALALLLFRAFGQISFGTLLNAKS